MSARDVATRRVRALSARTHHVSGYGQVSFDPDSERDELKRPPMPVDEIDKLVSWGWIADDVSEEDAAPAGDEAPAKPGARRRGGRAAPAGDEAPIE